MDATADHLPVDHPVDHAGMETLSLDTCLELLASEPVGRLGFAADGELLVLPVNHSVDGQDVVFHTIVGSKLTAAERSEHVAFEADHFDRETHAGWSVLVTGVAEPVYDEDEVARLDALAAPAWVSDPVRPYWVRIRSTSITGRRIPAQR